MIALEVERGRNALGNLREPGRWPRVRGRLPQSVPRFVRALRGASSPHAQAIKDRAPDACFLLGDDYVSKMADIPRLMHDKDPAGPMDLAVC